MAMQSDRCFHDLMISGSNNKIFRNVQRVFSEGTKEAKLRGREGKMSESERERE